MGSKKMSNRKDIKSEQGTYSDDTYTKEYLNPDFDWNTLHTRFLITLLRSKEGRENLALHEKLKEVLATREHIPTVKEAKIIRKKNQLAKQNR